MTYPNLPRCQHCGDMLLTEMAREIHEPVCADNPANQSTGDDDS